MKNSGHAQNKCGYSVSIVFWLLLILFSCLFMNTFNGHKHDWHHWLSINRALRVFFFVNIYKILCYIHLTFYIISILKIEFRPTYNGQVCVCMPKKLLRNHMCTPVTFTHMARNSIDSRSIQSLWNEKKKKRNPKTEKTATYNVCFAFFTRTWTLRLK